MKKQWLLTVTTLVTVGAIIACGKKNDSNKRAVAPIRTSGEEQNTKPTGKPGDDKLPSDSESRDPVKTTPEGLADQAERIETPMAELKASETCFLNISSEDSAEDKNTPALQKKPSDLIDNKKDSVWEFYNMDLKFEVLNSKTKKREQLVGHGEAKPEDDKVKVLPNKELLSFSKILCHTASGLIDTGLKSTKDSKINRTLRVQLNLPRTIDRESGNILLLRQDIFESYENKALAKTSFYRMPKVSNIKDYNNSDDSDKLNRSARVVSLDENLAVIELTLKEVVSSDITHSTVVIVKYKSGPRQKMQRR